MIRNIPNFSIGIDTVSTLQDKDLIVSPGEPQFDFVVRYIGSLTKSEAERILGAGKGIVPVTFGGWRPVGDGTAAANSHVATVLGWGAPKGLNIFLDLEAQPTDAGLISYIDKWSTTVVAAGFIAGLYVASGCQLTSDEVYKIKNITRYWRGCSHNVDRNNVVVEPSCGYSMDQMYPPNQARHSGLVVDYDITHFDFRSRSVNAWYNS